MNMHMRKKSSELAEFASEIPLAHELPYLEFQEDGTLVRGLRISPISIETKTDDEVNDLNSRMRSLLNSLPDGMEVQFQIDSRAGDGGRIEGHRAITGKPGPIATVKAERVEDLRRDVASGQIRELEILAFVYERQVVSGNLNCAFFKKSADYAKSIRDRHEVGARELALKVNLLSRLFESIGVESQVLSKSQVRLVIYSFLNPERSKSIPAPVENRSFEHQDFSAADIAEIPELALPSPREQLLFSDLKLSAESFRLDGLDHGIVSLKTLPEWTFSALVSRILTIPIDYTLSILLKVPEQSKEIAAIQAKRRVAFSMLSGSNGRVADLESEAKLESTEELLRELIQTGQKIFFFQIAVLLRAETQHELKAQQKTILSEFRNLNGAEGLAETYANFKVFKSMLPGGSLTQVRGKRIKTENLSDFLPIYGPYTGHADPVCLFRNRSGGLVQFDPFSPSLPNFNMLVTGSSGSGKSFLNNCIQLQHLSTDPVVFIVDIGGSYRKLCTILDGKYVELSPAETGRATNRINPFDLPPGEAAPSPGKLKFLVSLLESILGEDDEAKISKLSKSLLEETLSDLYGRTAPRTPTLSDLMTVMAGSSESALRDFAKMLYPWTGARPFGRILDGESTLTLRSDFVVFDLKGLSTYPDLQSVMVLIITDFILGRIDGTPRKKRILMDEVWSLLKSKGAASFMEYCARTLRKTGSGITFITQGLEEINDSDIGAAILNNTATKLILLQKGDLALVKSTLKLNDQELALISSLRQSKGEFSEAFLMTGDDRTVIQVSPTPLEYWVSTSDAADLNAISAEEARDPNLTPFEIIESLAKRYAHGMSRARSARNGGPR